MKKKPRKNKKTIRKVPPVGGTPFKGGRGVKKIKAKKAVKKLKPKTRKKFRANLRLKLKQKLLKKKKPVKKIKKSKTEVRGKIKRVKKSVKKPRKTVKAKNRTFKPRIYIGRGMLEQLFESQSKVKVLKFFFRNFQDTFTLKQIFRRLRTNVSLVRREIGKLEKLGLIKQKKIWLTIEKKRGGTRKEQKLVYCINTDFDFFNELKNLILKSTISSKAELINNVRKLGNIKILALAGIFTGDETAKADILIVGDKINSRKMNTFMKDLEAEIGKELNCSIMSTREFNYRYDMYDRFVRDLLGGRSEVLINRINLW